VAVYDRVRVYRQTLIDQTYILTADNGIPDWLGEIAVDHGTRQQAGETTDGLRARLRSFPDAVTPGAVKSAVDALLAGVGLGGCALVDLRYDRAFFGTWTQVGGSGGGIIAVGDVANELIFYPTNNTPTVPPLENRDTLTLTGFSAGNNGTFVITGFRLNGMRYINAAGAPGTFGGAAAWTWDKRGPGSPAPQAVLDGHRRAYYGRGYRYGSSLWTLIVILPFGADAGLAAAVSEMLRQITAGGLRIVVERRTSP
jgi:hypothetical protein